MQLQALIYSDIPHASAVGDSSGEDSDDDDDDNDPNLLKNMQFSP